MYPGGVTQDPVGACCHHYFPVPPAGPLSELNSRGWLLATAGCEQQGTEYEQLHINPSAQPYAQGYLLEFATSGRPTPTSSMKSPLWHLRLRMAVPIRFTRSALARAHFANHPRCHATPAFPLAVVNARFDSCPINSASAHLALKPSGGSLGRKVQFGLRRAEKRPSKPSHESLGFVTRLASDRRLFRRPYVSVPVTD